MDEKIAALQKDNDPTAPFLMEIADAIEIVERISQTFDSEAGQEWDKVAFQSSMEYLSKNSTDDKLIGKIWCVVRKDRNIQRVRADGDYEDAPDTPKGKQGELKVARQIAKTIPALILLRQNGKVEHGWRGSPFWWPVLVSPETTKTVVFASKSFD